jgi:N-formylmaleamate deformylase
MLPHWTQNNLVVNDISLHYTRTGAGDQPAVVLAHGFSDNGLCWLPVASDLERAYDVILPDARGHGLSARVEPGEKFDPVADLAGVIRGLDLDQPVLGGHSMGASMSAQVEAQYPGLVRALILEDPAWFNPEPPKETAQAEQLRPNPFAARLMAIKDQTIEQLMAKCRQDSPTWAEIELRPWAESKKQFDTNFFLLPMSPRTDWREVVQAIRCPTLLITANPKKGGIITPEIAQQAADMNSQIRVVRISKAGHNIRRENYPDYMKAVQRFLKKVAG